MRFCLLLLPSLATVALALPAPQDSLDIEDIEDLFAPASEPRSRSGEVVVQVVQLQQPAASAAALTNDYYESGPGQGDQATVQADTSYEECADYSGQGYECVPYYQCRNGSIITDGAGLIDIRNGFGVLDAGDTKCPGFLDVCCKDPDFVPPPPPPPKAYTAKCGRRNVNGLGARIQGFQHGEAQFGEWPHMCAVLRHDVIGGQDLNLYQCGGSLIAPGVVMTAAHCVEKHTEEAASLVVRCGEWDTQNQTEPYPHQDREVELVKVHPEYFGGALYNDVALLFTREEFVLSRHIDTVCLPQPGETFVTDHCFATGWGKDKFGASGQYQVVLKEVDLPVVDTAACQDSLRQTRLGKRFKLHDSFLCAGGEAGKDTCKGDGGSPLVCPSKFSPTSYVQAGVVAWGIGCGEDSTPGVYADVSQAVCWVDYIMSCYYGASTTESYWGYSSQTCGAWLGNKVVELQKNIQTSGPRATRIFQDQLDQYQECQVRWVGNEDLTDVSPYERDLDTEGSGEDYELDARTLDEEARSSEK